MPQTNTNFFFAHFIYPAICFVANLCINARGLWDHFVGITINLPPPLKKRKKD